MRCWVSGLRSRDWGPAGRPAAPVLSPVRLRSKSCRSARRKVLVLACVSEPLRWIFEMTGVDHVLRVFDTVTDAEAVFGG